MIRSRSGGAFSLRGAPGGLLHSEPASSGVQAVE